MLKILDMFKYVNAEMLVYLFIVALLMLVIIFCIVKMRDSKNANIKEKKAQKSKGNGSIISRLNESESVQEFGLKLTNKHLQEIFNRAKNPWKMTIPTFQIIRYGGLFLSLVVAVLFLIINKQVSIFMTAIGILFVWYPMYYYKSIGSERETEWSKIYEYIWVLKHNLVIYTPEKAYMNTKLYIEEHSPHNKEIIQGFYDFYQYWDNSQIDPYIEQYYPFSITREIVQIVFNMSKTGEFPEDSLNSLRAFIINQQDLMVTKILSSVTGKATIYSLPFLMISVILALMVPLVMQLINFM